MLDLVLQLGPCRIEPVGRRLLRVRGGNDQPAVVAAIRRAGGERDGTGKFWWLETRQLRSLADELRHVSAPLFRTDDGSTSQTSAVDHDGRLAGNAIVVGVMV